MRPLSAWSALVSGWVWYRELVVENSPKQANVTILQVTPSLKPFSIGICSLRRKLTNPLIHAFWELAGDSRLELAQAGESRSLNKSAA